MFDKKETILFIIILFLICIAGFTEYQVNKITKSIKEITTDIKEISVSIKGFDKDVSPELEELDKNGVKIMLR